MKKILFFFLFTLKLQSQEIFLNTGNNFTKYKFSAPDGNELELQTKNGRFYEIGYGNELSLINIKYLFCITINEYNSIGGNINNYYAWETQYLGLKMKLKKFILTKHGFDTSLILGFGIDHIIYGNQNISGRILNLTKQKEFKGFWISPELGLKCSYNIESDIVLSLGYSKIYNFNINNNSNEKLYFINDQINLGVNFIYR